MVNNTLLAAGLAIISMGGLAFVFSGGNSRAEGRRALVAKPEQKVNVAADRAAKKKQMSDSLKNLEKKSQRKGPDLAGRIEKAGLPINARQFIMISVGAGVAAA